GIRDGHVTGVQTCALPISVGLDDPFRKADSELEKLPADVDFVLVDMHAETTSEKVAMGWYLDGRVTAVVGTHTHVATADERVLRSEERRAGKEWGGRWWGD